MEPVHTFIAWMASPQDLLVLTTLLWLGILLSASRVIGRAIGKTRADHRETRCRKCAHILRGLTEPRCPECGERI